MAAFPPWRGPPVCQADGFASLPLSSAGSRPPLLPDARGHCRAPPDFPPASRWPAATTQIPKSQEASSNLWSACAAIGRTCGAGSLLPAHSTLPRISGRDGKGILSPRIYFRPFLNIGRLPAH